MPPSTPQPLPAAAVTAAVPASAAVNTLPNQKAEKPLPTRTPRSIIVFLLLVFPPLAWFFMWIDKTYHHWFAKILIFSGVFTFIYLLLFYISIVPNLTKLYASIGVPVPQANLILTSNITGMIFAVLQLAFGYYFLRVIRKNGSMNTLFLTITVFFLLFNLITMLMGPMMIVQAVYPLVSAL